MNSGVVSSILQGKRKVSLNLALKVCSTLNVEPQKREQLQKAFSANLKGTTQLQLAGGQSLEYSELAIDQFNVIADWYHFAILSLARNTKLENRSDFIAQRLGISLKVADKAVKTLLRLKLLELKKDRLHRSQVRLQTTEGIQNSAINRSHQTDCELALKSLAKDPLSVRDFSAITFCLNPSRLLELSKLIRSFEDRTIQQFENSEAEEVYKMSIHVFPLSQIKSEVTR